MKRIKSKPTKRHDRTQLHKPAEQKKSPFIEHVHELRKRLFYIALSVVVFTSVAFEAQDYLLAFIRHPAGDQIFITTTPGGAFNFLFRICITTGIIASIPVIAYQLLRYVQPLIKQGFMRMMSWACVASGVLAIIGVLFGYYCGLPSSLKFLFGQSANLHIQALITIDSYTSFITMYLLGSAVLFQVPLILILINKIKPLKPSKLLSYERPFIVVATVLGALLSPSPNIADMMILTVPMITMYQISIIIIWSVNRKHHRPKKVVKLLQKDAELQAARLAKFKDAQESWQHLLQTARANSSSAQKVAAPVAATLMVTPQAKAVATPIKAAVSPTRTAMRPVQRPARRPYFNDFVRRPYTQLSSNGPAIE